MKSCEGGISMKKMSKYGGWSLAVVSTTFLLAGCGQTSGSGNNSTGSAPTGPVTITFGTCGGATEDQQLQAIIKKINDANKSEFIIKEQNTPSNYDQKLNTEFAAGNAPDIFYINDANTPTYSKEGVLLNLDSYIQKYKSQYVVADPANYFQSSLANDQYQGHYYALPWIAQPVVMYYNPTLFKQAGLSEPTSSWTWDDFMKDAKALTNTKTGVYGYLQANGWPPIEDYIWSYGGHVWNSDASASAINSPAALQGVQLMQQMVQDKVVPPLAELANVDIESLFRQGRVAMFAGGAADGNYNSKGFTAKVAEMPMGTQHATQLYIADMGINAHTTVNKDVVFKAYAALLDAIDHWKLVPPVQQYAANLESISIPDAPGGHTPADRIQPILNSMKYAQPLRDVKNMSNYWTVMGNDLYQPILSGQTTPDKALQKAETDLNALIK